MMRSIDTKAVRPEVTVRVPGSKSYTHRTLIAAALSNGVCRIHNPLRSQDTLLTMAALKQMGVQTDDQHDPMVLHGCGGDFRPVAQPIHFHNSGTSMRLFSALVVLGKGTYTLTGISRMRERPMQSILDSLNLLGISAHSQSGNGCPPVVIEGGTCRGGRTSVDCGISSQYLSALLLIAPRLEKGLSIEVINGPVSKPYIDITLDIMNSFGVTFQQDGYAHFHVPGGQTYQAGDHVVETDGSNAGYFWAAAAITGSRVKVKGITATSRQGDVALVKILEQMGCRVDYETDGIGVMGGDLKAVTVDMGHMPDVAPTLAVVAAFAKGTTVIQNVAHLKAKECDRSAAVTQELTKMGIAAEASHDSIQIVGGHPRGAEIETYEDHRIAMSFALAGLKVPGVQIKDPGCVAKSFPNYWDVFDGLYI